MTAATLASVLKLATVRYMLANEIVNYRVGSKSYDRILQAIIILSSLKGAKQAIKEAQEMKTSKAEYRRRALKAWRTKRRKAKARHKK